MNATYYRTEIKKMADENSNVLNKPAILERLVKCGTDERKLQRIWTLLNETIYGE